MRITNVNGVSRLNKFCNFFRRDPNDFMSRLVTTDETWLYHYDPETKQQSMEWRHSGSPFPKNSECKNTLQNFSPRFFRIKTASFWLIIFQGAKLSTRSIAHLRWCNWRTFWRKNASGMSPKGSCSCTTIPRLTEHLQPRRNWPTWASSVLITNPILRICPSRTTTYSLDYKVIENLPFFIRRTGHCCRGDLVRRTTFWFFFWVLAKVRVKGWEVYWASWGVWWINPEFGHCSLFLSWSG